MKKPTAQELMWQRIRTGEPFTRRDLINVGDCCEVHADIYCRLLREAGIVVQVGLVRGRSRPLRQWQLAKDLGPLAPKIGMGGLVLSMPISEGLGNVG